MKKTATLILIAGASVVATPAFAQSSVRLYGVLDVGPSYLSNVAGHGTAALQSGISKQSRFGFEGEEDISNDLSAIFRLESGYNVTDGTLTNGGALFNRESWVGLSSRSVGSLLAGSINTTTGETTGRYTLATQEATGFYANHPGDYDRVTTFSASNSVKYRTPNWAGFTGQAEVIVGGVPGGLGQSSGFNVGGNYDISTFSVGASYMHQNGFDIPRGSVLKAAANPFGVTGATDQFNSVQLGASFAPVSAVSISGLITQSTFGLSDNRARTYEGGAKFFPMPRVSLSVDYSYTQVAGRAHLQIAAVGASYSLSKHTDLYAVAAYETVAGTNVLGTPLVAQLGLQAPSNNSKQAAVHTGIRMRF